LQIALTPEHVAGFDSVPFSELGGSCENKKIDKTDRIAVKLESADDYVGRPNNNNNK